MSVKKVPVSINLKVRIGTSATALTLSVNQNAKVIEPKKTAHTTGKAYFKNKVAEEETCFIL